MTDATSEPLSIDIPGSGAVSALLTAPAGAHAGCVLAHGAAPQKALLSVYLDRQPCRWTWASEANRFTSFKAGQSYFRDTQKAFITLWVSGHFSKAFTARAGATAQPEYACSYLTTPNSHGEYRITAARRSNARRPGR